MNQTQIYLMISRLTSMINVFFKKRTSLQASGDLCNLFSINTLDDNCSYCNEKFTVNGQALYLHHLSCIKNPSVIKHMNLDLFIKKLPLSGNCSKCHIHFKKLKLHGRYCFKNVVDFSVYLQNCTSPKENSINDIINLDRHAESLKVLPFFDYDFSINDNLYPKTKNHLDKIIVSISRNKFNFIHLNVNGLRHKLCEVFEILNLKHLDLFLLNETKLDVDVPMSKFMHPNYNILRLDRKEAGGGGLMVYLKKNYDLIKYEYTNFETIHFKTRINGCIVNFVASYKSPSTDNNNYLSELENLLLSIDRTEHIIIVGDLNMNLMDEKGNELRTFLTNNEFINCVNGFTRVNHIFMKKQNKIITTKSLIDVILHNSSCIDSEDVRIIKCPISDHHLIMANLSLKRDTDLKKEKVFGRCLNISKMGLINNELKSIDWQILNSINLIDDKW